MPKEINNTVKWRSVISIVCTILLAAVSWAFLEVRDLPKIYASKAEVREVKKDIGKRLDRIEPKIDRILWNRVKAP